MVDGAKRAIEHGGVWQSEPRPVYDDGAAMADTGANIMEGIEAGNEQDWEETAAVRSGMTGTTYILLSALQRLTEENARLSGLLEAAGIAVPESDTGTTLESLGPFAVLRIEETDGRVTEISVALDEAADDEAEAADTGDAGFPEVQW